MILDVDFGKADAEQGRGDHGADEGGTVAADDHGNGDGLGRNAEGLTDADDHGQHAVEVGVGVEGQSQRHGQDADDQRQLLAESGGHEAGDHVRKAADHGGQPMLEVRMPMRTAAPIRVEHIMRAGPAWRLMIFLCILAEKP